MTAEQIDTAISVTTGLLRKYRMFTAAGDLAQKNKAQARVDGFMEGIATASSWTLAGSIMSSATMRLDGEARYEARASRR